MTTNLSECMNNVLKRTRNLPISSLVQATYYRVTAKFEERGTQAQAMMTSGTFKVDLEKRWCDCGEFEALHYPCSHVISACSFIHCDYMMYVSSKYTLQCIFDVYKEEFQAIPLQSYWPEYNGIELCHNPAMRKYPKGRPQSTRIHTEIDQREKNTHPKRCGLCRNEGHSKNKCPYRTDTPNRN
ncbi:uncharacterized protein [Cicer arietinum]|uniref:uncharacterized protein n=1 Tax=Cicer arietinum TaxID=3827 RepID=UPI003CC5065B